MEKVRVMVVDDSKISRMMISSMLAKTNFEVCAMYIYNQFLHSITSCIFQFANKL